MFEKQHAFDGGGGGVAEFPFAEGGAGDDTERALRVLLGVDVTADIEADAEIGGLADVEKFIVVDVKRVRRPRSVEGHERTRCPSARTAHSRDGRTRANE